MQYFIPAWYQDGDWKEKEQVWYRSRTVTEFDDTVKQIQLFFRKHVAPFKIVLLGFSPNFRHFLHRQGVYHAPYWSCFDAMQGITSGQMSPFSFHDLSWPEGIEFIYSPFAVIANLNGQKYAQIEFAEDGNMFRVDIYNGEVLSSSNYYDDRGFISLQTAYQNGEPFREQYFNENGVWKFARYLSDGHVVINPESNWYFAGGEKTKRKAEYKKSTYSGIDEVISEVITESFEDVTDRDIFMVAMHPLHSPVLEKTLRGRKKVLSFFNRRLEECGISDTDRKLIAQASCIVADERATEQEIKGLSEARGADIRVITPYDSREETTISLHLHVQNVLVAVDQISEDEFNSTVVTLAKYVTEQNKRARIQLFTRSSQYNMPRQLLHKVRKALRAAKLDPEIAREPDGVSENSIEEEGGKASQYFFVAQCVDELSVSRTLREQRVIVDLSEMPDHFLQISAMSMGIPQITSLETDYIKDKENGIVVKDINGLTEAVDFYLSSISNVNNAQIASYKLGGRFTTEQLAQSWKEVIKSLEH